MPVIRFRSIPSHTSLILARVKARLAFPATCVLLLATLATLAGCARLTHLASKGKEHADMVNPSNSSQTLIAKAYPKSDIYQKGAQRSFTGQNLDQIAFPLGGIGAGQINLGGSGQLQDFSIFNRPAIGEQPRNAVMIYAKAGNGKSVARVIQGPITHSQIFDHGRQGGGGTWPDGLPRMRKATFRGEFPFASIDFEDPSLPLEVSLEAFSPFVPLDVKNSALPAAILKYTFRNPTNKTVEGLFVFTMRNPLPGNCKNTERREGKVTALEFANDLPEGNPKKGTFAIAMRESDVTVQETSPAGGGWGGYFGEGFVQWKEFSNGRFAAAKVPTVAKDAKQKPAPPGGGSVGTRFSLKPGESRTISLILAWHVPTSDANYDVPKGDIEKWEKEHGMKVSDGPAPNPIKWRPYYAGKFKSAFDVAKYAGEDTEKIEERTREFHDVFFASSFPSQALDAVSANLGILKSPTCLLMDDGQFWAYEGSFVDRGSCEGSCTHVWNYAQAMPHLFPQLERTLRSLELEHSMGPDGHVQFRSRLPIGPARPDSPVATDGQLGGIMKVWREWQISGDEEWLRRMYPLAKRSLDYGIRSWDPKRSGALTERQHNTYDIWFEGPNSMCTSFYLGALRAMADMAVHLGHADDAKAYSELADKGLRYANTELFNGEYYYQKIYVGGQDVTEKNESWSQYGKGCLSDGVIGQWFTDLFGLPDALDPVRARKHLESVFKYNFKSDLSDHCNPDRPTYALNDEAGLLTCTWPKGGEMTRPFSYAPEVWTGIEYQAASHMIMHGLVDEGLTVVKAVRDRYDGFRRNPWNEYECGNYYARALSSYAVFIALSGFRYSAVTQTMELDPRLPGKKMVSFFSTNQAWGQFTLTHARGKAAVTIQVVEGSLPIKALALPFLSGKGMEASVEGGIAQASVATAGNGVRVTFDKPVILRPGQPVRIRVD